MLYCRHRALLLIGFYYLYALNAHAQQTKNADPTFPAADQAKQLPRLKYLQAKIRREVLHTLQAGKISYLARTYDASAFIIHAYPTYYYSEPTGAAAGQFELQPDTLAGYAALYTKGRLALVTRAGLGGLYSIYPVNPPAAEKNDGLGSRDSTSYDIKLVYFTLPYQSNAFIFMLPPRLSPTIMGFYDQGKLRFVDENGQFYSRVEDLIIAKFGSRAYYLEMLAGAKKRAEEDRRWYQSHHSPYYPGPIRSK